MKSLKRRPTLAKVDVVTNAGGHILQSDLANGAVNGEFLGIVGGNQVWAGVPLSGAPNVLGYGADPNGSSDSRLALSTALTNNPAVYIPTGTYRIDGPLGEVQGDGVTILEGFETSKQILGCGYTGDAASTLLTSRLFHENFPGHFALTFRGQGVGDLTLYDSTLSGGVGTIVAAGNYTCGYGRLYVNGTTPLLADGVTRYSGAAANGYPSRSVHAAIKVKLGALTGTGAGTATIEQSNDSTFATGVTTAGTLSWTDADTGATKTFNGTHHVVYTARYLRVRIDITGTPTSWPLSVTMDGQYQPLAGVSIRGLLINAAGTGGASPTELANYNNDWNRWNTCGIELDRVARADLSFVWVNKQQIGFRFREVWDSYFGNIKVLKCGQSGTGQGNTDTTGGAPVLAVGAATNMPLNAATQLHPYNEYDSGACTNNSTFVQWHSEDNKYTQILLGRHTRRTRWFGLKCHGDLASNSIMTLAPHLRLEGANTNQFYGLSMNRAGAKHIELDQSLVGPLAADTNAGEYADRNEFHGIYCDSARTNLGAPSGTPSIDIIHGRHNIFVGSTWSSNPRIANVNNDGTCIGNRFIYPEDHNGWSFTDATYAGDISGQIQLYGSGGTSAPVFVRWVHPTTNVEYTWDGTHLISSAPPIAAPPFSMTGTLSVKTGASKWRVPEKVTVLGVYANVGAAPTGSSIIVDVRKNGQSIYSLTPANRPTIAASATASTSGAPDTTTLNAGDLITVDVVQIGSSTSGTDLAVTVTLQRAA